MDKMDGIKDNFSQVAQKMNLKDHEIELAQLFYYSGVNHALKIKSPDVPAIEKQTPTEGVNTPTMENQNDADGEQIPFTIEWLENEPVQPKVEQLTQAEIQLMAYVLRNILHAFSEHASVINRGIAHFWSQADKNSDTPESNQAFESLNAFKSAKSKLKSKYKALAAIQRKVKKAAKSS